MIFCSFIKKTVKKYFFLTLFCLPIITALCCLCFGRYNISILETIKVIFLKIIMKQENTVEYTIIMNIRLPRVLLAFFVGAGLSCSGSAFQSLFNNPLATPDTLGVASAASFGASLAMLFNSNFFYIQLSSFIWGLIACFITYKIGQKNGKKSLIMMILSGIVVSSLFKAFISLIKYVADPQDRLPTITYWLMGSMVSASYKSLVLGIPFIIIGSVIIVLLRWKLNILSLSEDESLSMGINIKFMQLTIIIASSLITASVVSMCGQIGWVGLLVPHISRMIIGSDNKKVIPLSISFGSVFMMIIDTIARSMTSSEIPLSVLTAIFGAPFFIFLLRKTGGFY